MERKGLEGVRFVGDKRNQVVFDVENCDRPELIDEIVDRRDWATFGPDTLAEARNRGYRLSRHCRTS